MVPNPADPECSSFLICTARSDPIVKECHNGLRFDPGCKCCNHAAQVRCGPQWPAVPSQTKRPDDNPCHTLRPGATLPNLSDATCNSFLVCGESGEPSVNNCPATLIYNPACKCCDYLGNAPCEALTTVTPATKRPGSVSAIAGDISRILSNVQRFLM